MARHGLLGSFVLKLVFSNGRTVYNMKRIVVCLAVPTQLNYLKSPARRHHRPCQSHDADISLPTVATELDPRRGRGNAKKKKKKISLSKQRKFHQVKVTSPFLLNKIMATSIKKQPRKTRFTLTTKQPRNTRFTTNYGTAQSGLLQSQLIKGRRLVVIVDSQSHSSSHQARVLGTSGKEEKKAGTPELVSTC